MCVDRKKSINKYSDNYFNYTDLMTQLITYIINLLITYSGICTGS